MVHVPVEVILEILLFLEDIDLFPTFFHVCKSWYRQIFERDVFWKLYITKSKKIDIDEKIYSWKRFFIANVYDKTFFLYERNDYSQGYYSSERKDVFCEIRSNGEVIYKKSTSGGCHFDHVDIPSTNDQFSIMLSLEEFRRVKQIISFSSIKRIKLSKKIERVLSKRKTEQYYSDNENWKIIKIRNGYFNKLPPNLFSYLREIKNEKKVRMVIFKLGYAIQPFRNSRTKKKYTFYIEDSTHPMKLVSVTNKSGEVFSKSKKANVRVFQRSVKYMKKSFSISGTTSKRMISLAIQIDFYNQGVNKRYAQKKFQINVGKGLSKEFLKFILHK